MSESSWMNGQAFHAYLRELFASNLSASAKVVGATLADFANDEKVAWPSASTIGKRVNMTRTAVVRVLGQLEAGGFIKTAPLGGHLTARRALILPSSDARQVVATRDASSSDARQGVSRLVTPLVATRDTTVLSNSLENVLSTGVGPARRPRLSEPLPPEPTHAELAAEADTAFGGDGDIPPEPNALMLAVGRYCDSVGIVNESTRYRIYQDCESWAGPEAFGPQIVAEGLRWGIEHSKPWKVVASHIRSKAETSGWVDKKAKSKPAGRSKAVERFMAGGDA